MVAGAVLTPLSAPGSIAPCTLAGVKAQLGIGDTSKDTELRALIRACGLEFAKGDGLRRDYWRRQWRVRTPGMGGNYLPLPVWPIESVSKVAEGPDAYTTTIAASEYEVIDLDAQRLYRFNGWTDSRWARPQGEGYGPLDYLVELVAGWLMPDQVTDFAVTTPTTTVAAGGYVRSTAPSLYLFQPTAQASLSGSEPTWPTTLGGTVTYAGTTWTAAAARRLPDDVELAGVLTVVDWFGGGVSLPRGIQSESHGGMEIAYDFVGARDHMPPIPPTARAVLAGYR